MMGGKKMTEVFMLLVGILIAGNAFTSKKVAAALVTKFLKFILRTVLWITIGIARFGLTVVR